jgi:hypothetical protein
MQKNDKVKIKEQLFKLHYIQYWCIDRKHIIYVARLRNEGKTSTSIKRAEVKLISYTCTNLPSQCNDAFMKVLSADPW